MRKVVFLLPDLGSGGAERVVSHLSNEMIRRGISVTILMLFYQRIAYQLDEKIEVWNCDLLSLGKMSRVKTLRKILKEIISSYNEISAVSFQDTCLNYLLAASVMLPIKIISTERNNPYRKGHGIANRFLASLPFLLSDFSVFQTDDARKYYFPLSKKKIEVIANPITSTLLRWQRNVSQHKLITVCRLHPQKNLPMAIEVVERIKNDYPDITLDIYGEGNQKDSLQCLIDNKHLGDSIKLKGTISNVQEQMAAASVFILTSDFEGISNSMLEAMSVGMPIVCTDCPIGGAKMMLSDGAGILVPVGDVDQFVEKIDGLFRKEDSAQIYAQNALAKARAFTIEEITNKWINILFNGKKN